MSKSFGQYIKDQIIYQDNRFFGGEENRKGVSRQYFTYKHVLSDDEIIINTNNLVYIKGNPVLIVDTNKAVYLKEWQVREAHNYSDICSDFWLVKLNRKFFKTYTFKNRISDEISMEKEQSFDDLLQIAREQDEVNMKVANGFMN